VPIDATDEHRRREDAEDRVGGAAFEREPAAEQPGTRPATAAVQAAMLVERRGGEEFLELYCRRGWIVAQPVPLTGR
jgi:hypothetical protein